MKIRNTCVVAIPEGGAPVGYWLSNLLNLSFDVIVVDDMVWNSDAILASLRSIRRQDPARIVVVVPFITEEAACNIRKEVDDLFFLYKSRYVDRLRKLGSAFSIVTREDVKKFLLKS